MPLDFSQQPTSGGGSDLLSDLLKGGNVAFGPADGGNGGSTVAAPKAKTHARSEP